MYRLPCEGVKVLDFSWVYTGPIITKFLAEAGAEVIKVESPNWPDDVRGFAPFKDNIPGINRSMLFAYYNDSKYSLTLDLTNPKGKELARRLIQWCDVIVESFRPGAMKKLGFGYEDVQNIKPGVVMLSFSMQGESGPYSLQPTFGAFFQSLVGFADLIGLPGQPPMPPACPYPDFIGPWFALVSILAGLDYKKRTGEGLHIDMSQLETSLQFILPPLLDFSANGRIVTRQGNDSSRASPHGIYRCKGNDRWCAIASYSDEQWKAACRVIERPDLVTDSRFLTKLNRLQNSAALNELIEQWTLNHTPEEVMELMQSAGIPAGVVQNGQDLIEKDPQIKHRQHWVTLQHPEIGEYYTEVPPAKFSSLTIKPQRPAPCFGEHNEYVCKQILGMSDEEFIDYIDCMKIE